MPPATVQQWAQAVDRRVEEADLVSPYDVLESGTRAVAEHFGAAGDFSTVEVGKRADLLLLKGNPLESVGNGAHRAGVMAGGRWLSEDEIQRRLAEIAAHYTAQELP